MCCWENHLRGTAVRVLDVDLFRFLVHQSRLVNPSPASVGSQPILARLVPPADHQAHHNHRPKQIADTEAQPTSAGFALVHAGIVANRARKSPPRGAGFLIVHTWSVSL